MYRLSFLILFISFQSFAQTSTVHGVDFKEDCKKCHNSTSWTIDMQQFQFDHNATGFILDGMHKKADCKSCHKALVFTEAKSTCASCHADVHGMSVGNDCVRCHNTNSWLVDNIPELHQQNGFPIVGVHKSLACVDCHKSETNLRWDRIGNDCIACHQTNFTNTLQPNHTKAGFSTDCITCHDPNISEWGTAGFHTSFPLVLGHDVPDCKSCHTSGNFTALSTECVSCHQTTFNNTTAPSHTATGFSTNCVQCHSSSPQTWSIAGFHSTFPLTFGHNVSSCTTCHKNSNFNDISKECVSCHQNNFNTTTLPPHSASGFSTNCTQCHSSTPVDWKVSGYHNEFALTLEHNIVDCKACHKTDNFLATSSECVSCHQNNFNSTTLPPHSASGFSTNCTQCHSSSPVDWKVSGYHNSFALTLGHNIVDCKACHKTDNFPATSSECVSCHLNDYNGVTSPNHVTNGFGTNCISCHTTAPGWAATATVQHDALFFPINSGKHKGEWNSCTDCHTTPNNYKAFSCITCHEHSNASSLAKDHDDVSGYVFSSAACYACHPKGSE